MMKKLLLSVLFFTSCISSAYAVDIAGHLELEISTFLDDGQFAGQDYRTNTSLALAPEFYREWNDGNSSLTFTPFIRIDERDNERSHGDIRELLWVHVNGDWEWRAGIGRVFWGVTEFNHLVDVINQTDAVDAADGEEKLGQPMINLSRVNDWGIVDFFILPGFRERTFAGSSGRLRSGLIVDEDRASYESSDEEKHVDFALRWSHSFGVFDMGAYVFDGTDREPILQVSGLGTLTPFYQQVTQTGVDLQATVDSWLWKLEALHKHSNFDDYLAAQAGFEYTFYGLNESPMDLGVLLEYGWDERDIAGGSAQNDVYLGMRFTFNDAEDTAILAGVAYDADFHSNSFLLEASRRLSDYWTIALESQFFHATNNNDPISSLGDDDHIKLVLERHF